MTGTGESRTGRRAFQLLLSIMFFGLIFSQGRDVTGASIFAGHEAALQFIRGISATAFVLTVVFFGYDVLLLRTGRQARRSILVADIWLTSILSASWMLCMFIALGGQPFKRDAVGKLAAILAFGSSLLWMLQSYLLIDYLPASATRVSPSRKKNKYPKLSIASNDTVDFYADDDDLLFNDDPDEVSFTSDDPVAVLMLAHNESDESPAKSALSSLGEDPQQQQQANNSHTAQTFFMEDEDISLFQ